MSTWARRRSASRGWPSACGSSGFDVEDLGNVVVSQREQLGVAGTDAYTAIADVCRALAVSTAEAVRDGVSPLILGGDHSLAMGSVAGVATALAERKERLGLIWLDAHGDINTPETSESGNIHGMPLAHLLGQGDERLSRIAKPYPAIREENLVMVGLRDLDQAERIMIGKLGLAAFTMRDIDQRGLANVMADAITIAGRGTGGIHVSCDPDWIDPIEAPGVGTPVRGGVTYREAHLALGDGRGLGEDGLDGLRRDQSRPRRSEYDGLTRRRSDRQCVRQTHFVGTPARAATPPARAPRPAASPRIGRRRAPPRGTS